MHNGAHNIWRLAKIVATHTSNSRFSVLLRNARKRAGMTQRQLAELSTVSVRAIRDLELEHTQAPRTQTIALLADALRLGTARRAELEAAAGLATRECLLELATPPAPLGSLVGRQRETDSLTGLLVSSGHRLVKVVGLPGVGKTRLIQKVASDLHRSGRLPVIYLDRDAPASGAPQEAARGLVARISGLLKCEPALEAVTDAIAANDALLVVDGADLDEDGELALRLLVRRCPGLRVLYETRETPLTSSDTVFSVPPLAVPDRAPQEARAKALAEFPSVQFMVARCAQLYPEIGFAQSLAAIADICRHLDGIPSALESAASWLLVYEPAQLLDVAARSPLMLTSSSASTGDSSLTAWLRATVASLSAEDAEALRELAEAGACTLEEVVGVLRSTPPDALRSIHVLFSRGLVRRAGAAADDRPRFTVLNLVRHLLRCDGEPARSRVEQHTASGPA
ncbi:helix-turn-helix domain-containing protein [Kitasatospora sp. NPDC006697]|uniref:helix-turn-helix domain-containing protein n=1 Tax=Kitasatospora sp. NPDC006697 TaxID=3364020 RepID=UPI0036A609D2